MLMMHVAPNSSRPICKTGRLLHDMTKAGVGVGRSHAGGVESCLTQTTTLRDNPCPAPTWFIVSW